MLLIPKVVVDSAMNCEEAPVMTILHIQCYHSGVVVLKRLEKSRKVTHHEHRDMYKNSFS